MNRKILQYAARSAFRWVFYDCETCAMFFPEVLSKMCRSPGMIPMRTESLVGRPGASAVNVTGPIRNPSNAFSPRFSTHEIV